MKVTLLGKEELVRDGPKTIKEWSMNHLSDLCSDIREFIRDSFEGL